jgi:hypothetical protein
MTLGHPALVTEADDHAAHLRAVLHYLQNLNQTQARPSPLGFQLMYAHVMQHLEALRKKDPAMAKQAEDAFAVVLQGMAAAQQQAQAQIPGANGAAPAGSPAVPGPGAGAPPLVQAPGPGRGVSPTTTSNPSYRVYPAST